MSNELTIFTEGLPSYLKELGVDETTKALMGGAGSTKRISIKGGVWRMMVGGKEIAKNEDRAIDVVIIAAAEKPHRAYYDQQYVEGGKATAPLCYSINGETPAVKSAQPQARRCIDCAHNVKGSGQGTSRACRYNQPIAVVMADNIDGDVYQMTLPGASVFGDGESGKWPLKAYANILGNNGVRITAVVTEMRFDTDSATPKVTFKPKRVLNATEYEIVSKQAGTPEAKRVLTMTVAEIDQIKTAIGLPSTSVSVEDTTEEDPKQIEEPVKKTQKKEEVPEKKSIDAIMEEWDD